MAKFVRHRVKELDSFEHWEEKHRAFIEEEFLASLSPEDQPLDDDIPDFLDNHWEEIEEFAKKLYNERLL